MIHVALGIYMVHIEMSIVTSLTGVKSSSESTSMESAQDSAQNRNMANIRGSGGWGWEGLEPPPPPLF